MKIINVPDKELPNLTELCAFRGMTLNASITFDSQKNNKKIHKFFMRISIGFEASEPLRGAKFEKEDIDNLKSIFILGPV